MNNYLKVVTRNNDLVAFDAEWDAAVEILESTELRSLVDNDEILKVRYFEQVKIIRTCNSTLLIGNVLTMLKRLMLGSAKR